MSPDGSTNPPPPEEKLLKLIRQKGAQSSTAALSRADSASSVTVIIDRSARQRPWPWVRLAVGGLGTVLVAEIVWLAIQVTRPTAPITFPNPPPSLQREPPRQVESPKDDLPSLEASASGPLFAAPPVVAASPKLPTPRPGPSNAAKQLASRLTLMGIVSGNPPQAIIEDSQTKKTYFVTTGQAVVEGALLDQVLDNRIILDLDGEKIELTL